VLLDTHVLIWMVDDHPRLGPKARSAIVASSAPRFSAASTWEMAIKAAQGRMRTPRGFDDYLRSSGLTDLPVSVVHTLAVEGYPQLNGHDPFDRLLVAQAGVEQLNLLTADARLLAAGLPFTLDARL
jgi:PIN domain nuclease of toxin-antitoxin system